ncbi:hypothetical protein BC938DRAFT_482246 [Jimgerdemannia flammicorona]|uniref:Uncharacterized protein n=1 Tax=Jimgerdemannia flammicorona TaxID=994334 RepID=A0A433QED7_9FUNG|nr:hypothetical protein BC938DRAFT_482246 [Jimgerdemannia flammicorona]
MHQCRLALLGQNGAGSSFRIWPHPSHGWQHPSLWPKHTHELHLIKACRELLIDCQPFCLFQHIELCAGIKNILRAEIAMLMEDQFRAMRLWNIKHSS